MSNLVSASTGWSQWHTDGVVSVSNASDVGQGTDRAECPSACYHVKDVHANRQDEDALEFFREVQILIFTCFVTQMRCNETDKFDCRFVNIIRIHSFEFEGSLEKPWKKMNGPSHRKICLNEALLRVLGDPQRRCAFKQDCTESTLRSFASIMVSSSLEYFPHVFSVSSSPKHSRVYPCSFF